MLKTESQRTHLCTTCPIAKVADLVGDSCTLLIIRDLLKKPRRFGELTESLSGISSRTITKKLKYLEEQEIIVRTEFNERPPRVEYSLTKKGSGLKTLVKEMERYGKELGK
ncbi:MAG: helix-turn-helix domain-containing protein [Candidatus Zambryskibacteria bacterium]|nr:helix-turn-helix domain-containing protein [Candidatus Zambryskibacteria bacterium]